MPDETPTELQVQQTPVNVHGFPERGDVGYEEPASNPPPQAACSFSMSEIERHEWAEKVRAVACFDKRDRLGLEHDAKGRFAKKGDGYDGLALALKSTDQKKLAKVKAVGNYTTADGKTHDTRINANTGKPISKQLNDCINALMCGIRVSDAEIESSPEWKEARTELRFYRASILKSNKHKFVYTHNIDTDERKRKRKAVEEKFMSDTITRELNPDAFGLAEKEGRELKPWKVERGKVIDIITGLPAAGKSTTFANKLSVENKARLIDSDEVKKQFPEFNRGLGADLVHEESSRIATSILQRSVARGDNITYPVIGHKPDKLRNLFKHLREHGYTIRLHLNELEVNKARGRMLLRFAERGRFLPLTLFRKYGNKPTECFNEVKGEVDSYDWYRSDTGLGEKPKLMEKGEKK